TGDESNAEAKFLGGSLLVGGVDLDTIAELAGVVAAHDGTDAAPDISHTPLNLTVLSALNATVPNGLNVPLGDFLQLGAVNQYAEASDEGASRAVTGAV